MLIFSISSEQKIIQLIYTNFLVVNRISFNLMTELVIKSKYLYALKRECFLWNYTNQIN